LNGKRRRQTLFVIFKHLLHIVALYLFINACFLNIVYSQCKINEFCYDQLLLGGSWDAFWPLLGLSCLLLGRSWPLLGHFWCDLGALSRSWPLLVRSWAALGRSWAALGPLFRCSWAALQHSKKIKKRSKNDPLKEHQKHRSLLDTIFRPNLGSQELRAREIHTSPLAKIQCYHAGAVEIVEQKPLFVQTCAPHPHQSIKSPTAGLYRPRFSPRPPFQGFAFSGN